MANYITKVVVDGTDASIKDTETSSNLSKHVSDKNNPHSVTKAQIGLGNVDNTADVDKPISTAVQTALNGKSSTSHTHSKINYKGRHSEIPSGTKGNDPTAGVADGRGLYLTGTYNTINAVPVPFGNIINAIGEGSGQLLLEWSGRDNNTGNIYYRSHRDNASSGGWSPWKKVAFTEYADSLYNTLSGVDSGLKARIAALENKPSSGITLDQVYPVGSIYMSVNDVDPATLFGGTWVRIQDKFLLASGPNYPNGNTGGEARHTLSVDEMPKHNHTVNTYHNHDIPNHSHTVPKTSVWGITQSGAEAKGYGLYPGSGGFNDRAMIQRPNTDNTAYLPETTTSTLSNAATYWAGDIRAATSQTGGSTAHNNMPPYLAVNVWKRTK